MSRAVILMNLGTPTAAEVPAVRRYLREFLMDRHVIDLPGPLRALLVGAVILPTRPRRSAAAYAKIWDAAGPGTGSPLLHFSHRLTEALGEVMDMPCELTMRYGEPDIASAFERLGAAGVDEVLLIPLYPQHAASTRETSIEAARAALPAGMQLAELPPFYDDPGYLDAQAALIDKHLPDHWDHLLLSYHGLPERHLVSADPTGNHCLKSDDCCQRPSPAHATCYRHQALATSEQLAVRLGIEPERWSVSFQSRLGRLPWLAPYTDEVLAELPGRGVQNLAVACPAFVADNLETLEEIGMAGRERFESAGGRSFTLIPCLNDDPDWIRALAAWIHSCEAQISPTRLDTAR